MQRSESLRAEVGTPWQDVTPAQKQSWRDCPSKTVSMLRSPLCRTFLSILAGHMLLCVHLLPFLALSRIRTISAEQVKDYVGVSSKFQQHPSQGDLYFNGNFRKWIVLGPKENETLREEQSRVSVGYSSRRCLLCLVLGSVRSSGKLPTQPPSQAECRLIHRHLRALFLFFFRILPWEKINLVFI